MCLYVVLNSFLKILFTHYNKLVLYLKVAFLIVKKIIWLYHHVQGTYLITLAVVFSIQEQILLLMIGRKLLRDFI